MTHSLRCILAYLCELVLFIGVGTNGSSGPVTVAAVAIVVVASRTAGACDMHMCRRASEASGLSQETLLSYARKALAAC